MADIPAELSEDDLVRIAKLCNTGGRREAMRDYNLESVDVSKACQVQGNDILAKRAEEYRCLRDSWSPPKTRPILGKGDISLTEAICWLGLGQALSAKELVERRRGNGLVLSYGDELALAGAWEKLLAALKAGTVAATGCLVKDGTGQPRRPIPHYYFNDPVAPRIDARDSVFADLPALLEHAEPRSLDEFKIYEFVMMPASAVATVGNEFLGAPEMLGPTVSAAKGTRKPGKYYPLLVKMIRHSREAKRGESIRAIAEEVRKAWAEQHPRVTLVKDRQLRISIAKAIGEIDADAASRDR